MSYRESPADRLCQGDVISGINWQPLSAEGWEAATVVCHGAILSHDCEIAKAHSLGVLVAIVRPMAEIEYSKQFLVREKRVVHAFPLEPVGAMPESWIDLRVILVVSKSSIRNRMGGLSRIASLSEEQCAVLRRQLVRFFTRADIPILPEN